MPKNAKGAKRKSNGIRNSTAKVAKNAKGNLDGILSLTQGIIGFKNPLAWLLGLSAIIVVLDISWRLGGYCLMLLRPPTSDLR